MTCHEIRAVLKSRAQLVKIKRDIENQVRGLLNQLSACFQIVEDLNLNTRIWTKE